jgi:hypothetical protein
LGCFFLLALGWAFIAARVSSPSILFRVALAARDRHALSIATTKKWDRHSRIKKVADLQKSEVHRLAKSCLILISIAIFCMK